jgi:hypothetical protein
VRCWLSCSQCNWGGWRKDGCEGGGVWRENARWAVGRQLQNEAGKCRREVGAISSPIARAFDCLGTPGPPPRFSHRFHGFCLQVNQRTNGSIHSKHLIESLIEKKDSPSLDTTSEVDISTQDSPPAVVIARRELNSSIQLIRSIPNVHCKWDG